MVLVKEFANFGSQGGWNNHTFSEQNTSLLDREGLSTSVEPFELRAVGVLAEKSEVRPARLMNFFTTCSSISFSVIERSLSKVTGR